MNSVKEYKTAIKIGSRVQAVIRYKNGNMKTVVGTVDKVQIKKYRMQSETEGAFWLSFPLLKDASFMNRTVFYNCNGNECAAEILSVPLMELLAKENA